MSKKNPRTSKELRSHPSVADLSYDGEVWDCLLVKGWCFDQSRHMSVQPRLGDILNEFWAIEPCKCTHRCNT